MTHDNYKKLTPHLVAYLIVVALIVFAVYLARSSLPGGPERITHIVFAVVAAPTYIFAHYFGR
jgi:hypothetical protein